MSRLLLFGIILLITFVIWIAKQMAGPVSGSERLQQTSFKDQTQRSMESTARGINWLDKQWEEAKKNRHSLESDSMDELEESLYKQVAMEVASKTMQTAIAAKAFSEADGDEKKATARYIKLRVAQLRKEFEDKMA